MESKQPTPSDDDDFYPMNDEETSDYYGEDDTETSEKQNQDQEEILVPDTNAKMELFRYQENLFKEIASKKASPSRYELDTGSYFDYHLNRFSRKFQERVDDDDIAANVFLVLQEFIQMFKNCKAEDAETRAAGLTGYLNQIKKDVDREYQKTFEAGEIIEESELLRFLEGALLWRIEHCYTEFPDIQEIDVSEELVQIEAEIKSQYFKLNKEDLVKLLQSLKEMKICPLWHQKVCKRLELRRETLRLIEKLDYELYVKEYGRFQQEVPYDIFEEIKTKRLQMMEEKEKIIIDEAEFKVSDSFEIPSSSIIGGTYFDHKRKEMMTELESINLRLGSLPLMKIIKEIIEVVNVMFNTPCEWFFFDYHLKDLLMMVKDQQAAIEKIKESKEVATEIIVFMRRFVHILEDILAWKEETKSTHGDVKNSEVDLLLQSIEIEIPKYEEYSINVTRLSVYMTAKDYDRQVAVLNKELDRLVKARLVMNNIGCVERFDDLVEKLEGMIEGLKEVYEVRDKNYQALRKMYMDHKYMIGKGIYGPIQRDDHANQFKVLVEDLDKRFGGEFDYPTRKNYLSWVNELRTLQLGDRKDLFICSEKPCKKETINKKAVKEERGMIPKTLPSSIRD